jgi:deoxyhypusine synthase
MDRIDLTKIKTYSLKKRKSKVKTKEFASVCAKSDSFRTFYDSLPNILAASDFRNVVDAIVKAYKKKKEIIFMLGAHVIKCGLSPVIIDLINRGIIKCLVLNGAGVIHDFEIAYIGYTSEDVAKGIQDGSFGMAKETATFINNAIRDGASRGLGLGESVARAISSNKLRFKNLSLLYNALKNKIPVTVHVALGTDIIHQHPSCDGSSVGEASLRDFRRLTEEVSKLGSAGVVVNFGSAVVLPEVFLKSVTVARNLGFKVRNFITANFDMIYHYRPAQNVVYRPTIKSGKGYYIIGHHEIMIPFLARAIIDKL